MQTGWIRVFAGPLLLTIDMLEWVLWSFCFKERFGDFFFFGSAFCMLWSADIKEATTVTAIALFNSLFTSLSFSFHPNVIYPLLLLLPPREKAHAEPSKHFDMRKESLPPPHRFISLSLSPHSLCRSSWLTPLCFKSRIPALSWALSRSVLYKSGVFGCLSKQARDLQTHHFTSEIGFLTFSLNL